MILLLSPRWCNDLEENLWSNLLQESSHFQFYSPNNTNTIQNLEESQLYQEDWIGLKTLHQKHKLHFLTMLGDHMDLDKDWFYQNIVVKYLL